MFIRKVYYGKSDETLPQYVHLVHENEKYCHTYIRMEHNYKDDYIACRFNCKLYQLMTIVIGNDVDRASNCSQDLRYMAIYYA